MLPDDILGHIVNQWSAVDEGGCVKGNVLQGLLDHLPDGGLREGPVVNLLRLLAGGKRSLPGQYRLHLYLNHTVVRYFINLVSHNGIGDLDVSDPQLVKLVTVLKVRCPLPKGRSETGLY